MGLCFGEVTDRSVVAGLQHVAPSDGARTIAFTRVLSTRVGGGYPGRGGLAASTTCFAAALGWRSVIGDVHRDGAAVFAQDRAAELPSLNGGGAGHAASWCAAGGRRGDRCRAR